jgi:hypothetical protein
MEDECPFLSSDEDLPESVEELLLKNEGRSSLTISTRNTPFSCPGLPTPTEESCHTAGHNVTSSPVYTHPHTPPTDLYGECSEKKPEVAGFVMGDEYSCALEKIKEKVKGVPPQVLSKYLATKLLPYLEKAPCVIQIIAKDLSVKQNKSHLVDERSATEVAEILCEYLSLYRIDGLFNKWIEDIYTVEGCNIIRFLLTRLYVDMVR